MVVHKRRKEGWVAGHPRDAELIEFDDGNESELAAHQISPVEVEQLFANDPKWAQNKKRRAGLWKAIGYTDGGRALTVPVMYDEIRLSVRPITGWDATAGERNRYL
jgi:uncharacterized DUF497 family protein